MKFSTVKHVNVTSVQNFAALLSWLHENLACRCCNRTSGCFPSVELLKIGLKELSQSNCPFLDPRVRRLMGTGGSGDENNLLHSFFLSTRSLSAFSAYSSRPSSGPALPPLINSSLHKSHHSHTFSSFGQQSSSRTMFYRTFSQVNEEGDCVWQSRCGAMIMDLFRMKRII